MKTTHRQLRAGQVLACTAIALIATSAAAQDAAAPAGVTSTADQEAAPTDIIVTATRRAENIQSVPLSVSAVTGRALQDNNIHDFSRLDVLVPGLKFGQSGNDARPAIRGTRTQQVVGNADPLVGFYNDGIYRSRPSQALGTFVDVERVEVLRGPQGTLFGRNTFGGAVNVISRAPKLGELDLGGAIEVGNYQALRAEGFVNVPIGDKVAIRLSGYDSRRDGWVKNIGNRSNDLHDERNQVVRGQIKVALSDDIINITRVEYWHGGGAGPGDYGYFAPGIPINPVTGNTNGQAGVIDPRLSTNANPNAGGFGGLAPNTPGYSNYKRARLNFEQRRKINQLTISNETTVGLGDFADLKAILSYTRYNEFRQGDPDYTEQPIAYQNGTGNTRTYSEEVQLTSKPGSRFSWVGGVYLLQDRPRGGYNYGRDFSGTIPGFQPIYLYSFDNQAYFSGPEGSYTNSYAFYADGTYRVTDWLRVLGGARYTKDKKQAYINNNAGTALPPDIDDRVRRSFDRVTYRAGVQADIGARSMLYGTYSTGFLSGGFSSLTPFRPTYSSAIEIGSKNTLLDGKLRANVALYRNRYRDIITQILNTLPNGAVITTAANAGKIKSYGAEGELDYYPTREAYIGVRLAYNHSRFGSFIAPNNFYEGGNLTVGCTNGFRCPYQLSGLQVPLNPTISATLIGSYDVDTGTTGIFTPQVTIFHSSRYRTSDQPYFFAVQKSYETVDAHLRWRPSADSRFALDGFINNLTDKRILLRTTPNSGEVIFQDFANPRMYGLRASFNY